MVIQTALCFIFCRSKRPIEISRWVEMIWLCPQQCNLFMWGDCFRLLIAFYIYFYSDDSTKGELHLLLKCWTHICKYNLWLIFFFAYIIWENRGWLCMPIISLLVILSSKHQKQVKYWKWKMEDYNVHSDKGAVTDSQDEFDHGVHLMEPNVISYKKK